MHPIVLKLLYKLIFIRARPRAGKLLPHSKTN